MAENAEAERHISQAMLAVLSVALGIGMQIQHQRAAAARRALAESEDRQKELAAQLAAERETAAVLWAKIDDREWVRNHPQQVAEAWASARAWERVDTRAAEARARFDTLLGALYDQRNPLINAARDAEDYKALAMLLQRAVDVDPELEGTTRFYEEVPTGERQAWLEREVWGPDSSEDNRIARSAELADVQAGLPVSVLREMPEEVRAAWLELQAMSPQERYAWRRAWLERQVWGPDSDPATREARARALADLIASSPDTPVDFTPLEWNSFVNEYRDRLEQAGTGSTGSDDTAAAERAVEPEIDVATSAPDPDVEKQEPPVAETKSDRLERVRAAVRESWPPEVADAVIGTDAFGALAHGLHQLEERGYAMTDILGKIAPEGLIGLDRYGQPVRDSAALAQYHVKQLAKSLPPRAEAEAGLEKLEQYVADHQQPGESKAAEAATPTEPTTRAASNAPAVEREAPGSASDSAASGPPETSTGAEGGHEQVEGPSPKDSRGITESGPSLREEDVAAVLSRPPTPASPWSRAGADQRGLGGTRADSRDDAAFEDGLAAEDHLRAEQLRGEHLGDVLDVGGAAPAPAEAAQADALVTEAYQRDNAAGEHETAAENLRGGAYPQGGDAAQLAGESYPRDIQSSLARGGRRGGKQGKAPAARRWRGPQAERGR